MPKKSFEQLPQGAGGVIKKISDFLEPQDLVNLSQTERMNQGLFQPELNDRFLQKLLSCVVKGEQDKAERILNQHSNLLSMAGSITDYSGRTFQKATAFQLALWSKDRHMWSMMLRCIPPGAEGNAIRTSLLEQYHALEQNGLHFSMKPLMYCFDGQTHTIKGENNSKCYNMQPLLDAMRFYVEHYDQWRHSNSFERLAQHWCRVVGLLQRTLPAHVINEYCRLDRSFFPTPDFNEENLPRTFTVYDAWNNSYFQLFPQLASDTSALGISYALSRGDHFFLPPAGAAADTLHHFELGEAPNATRDLLACQALELARTNDRLQIPHLLQKQQHAPAPNS